MPYDLKKLLASAAAIGALGFGGSAIAGAATSNNSTPAPAGQAGEQPGTAAETPGNEASEPAEKGGSETPEAKVAATDAKAAGDAALAKVGSGKVTDVSAETPNANEAADSPEKGETPDPAYEKQIAFDVEVTKADGSVVDVALDKSFSVLGTQAGEQGETGDHDEQGGQPEAAEVAPAQ